MRRRTGTVSAFRLAIIGTLLAGVSAVVTYQGQMASYGHLVSGFYAFETAILLLLVSAVAGLRSSHRLTRSAAEAIGVAAAIWMLGVAVSILGELLGGAREPWLPYDCGITAVSGLAWAGTVVVARIEDRRSSSKRTA